MDGVAVLTSVAATMTSSGIAASHQTSTYPTFASFTSPGNTSSSSLAVPDVWDYPWTDEQRRQIDSGAVSRQVLVFLGLLLSVVVVFGLVANATILYVFSRFKRLRTPANVFIINLTVCDLLSCLIHPMAIYSSFRGRWAFGSTGCNFYGAGVGFFGVNSIVTLSAIALERYVVITSSSCRSVVAKWRITRAQARKICAGIWLHCAALVAPPWLFGWSSYQPEGALVSCSWDYTTRTLSNRLYYLYLLTFGFVLPVGLLAYCYAAIFRFIVRSSREMTRLIMRSDGRAALSKTSISFRNKRRQTDVRTALIILSLALACFAAWTPYAVVSLVGQFAPIDDDESGGGGKLSPLLTSLPAFFAKTAIFFNPLVYGFSHPQFRSSVRQMLHQYSVESSANVMARPANNDTNTITMTVKRHRVVHKRHMTTLAAGSPLGSSSNRSDNKRAGRTSAAILRLERLVNGKAGKGARKRAAAGSGLGPAKGAGDASRLSADSRAESLHCSPSNSDDDERVSRDSGVSIQQQRLNEEHGHWPPVRHGADSPRERRRASAPDLDTAAAAAAADDETKNVLFRSFGNLASPDPIAARDPEIPVKRSEPEVFRVGHPIDGQCQVFEWTTRSTLSCSLAHS